MQPHGDMKGIPGPKLAILILGITVDSQLTRMMTKVRVWHRADRVINDRRSNPGRLSPLRRPQPLQILLRAVPYLQKNALRG